MRRVLPSAAAAGLRSAQCRCAPQLQQQARRSRLEQFVLRIIHQSPGIITSQHSNYLQGWAAIRHYANATRIFLTYKNIFAKKNIFYRRKYFFQSKLFLEVINTQVPGYVPVPGPTATAIGKIRNHIF